MLHLSTGLRALGRLQLLPLRRQLLSTSSTTSSTTAQQQQQPPPDAESERHADAATADATAASAAALVKRCDELQASLDQLQDKYVRALAESENTRRRLTKQADEARVYGISSFCKDLLEVADVLVKAGESVPKGADPALVEGLRMTEAQLQQVFRRHKLDRIEPAVGEKFDPNQHEALFEVPVAEGRQPGTVAMVTKIGYRLQERTLRPALVGVVKYT